MTVIGIPTTRVSDLFVRDRLLRQAQFDQTELFRIQMQLSTGRRIQLPSEDPVASLQVVSLQRLLERKEQVLTNLDTNQSFLTATDVALSRISSMAAEARGAALGAMGTTASDTQRGAAAQQIDQIIKQMVDAGNQKFRGRYLFAGTSTMERPFEYVDGGFIQYVGNEGRLSSYADIDLLFDSNLTGSEVFGAVSSEVRGSQLQPALAADTRLADLHGGQGISPGALEISGGGNPIYVDISGGETIGDVAAKIRSEGVKLEGKWLSADVTPKGLVVELHASDGGPPGTLTIREVGGGTTAYELGILKEEGPGSKVEGKPLDPMLRNTTSLRDLLGTRATAFLHMVGTDNDLVIEADRNGSTINGASVNGVRVEVFNDPLVTAGNETVEFAGGTLTVRVREGATRAYHVIEAFQKYYDPQTMPFTAKLDPSEKGEGTGPITLTDPAQPVLTDWGAGENLDTSGGLQINNGSQQVTVSLATAKTVEDLLNAVNGKNAGLLAEINASATGVNIRSRYSGADFSIGENGGTTASQLGLRTLTGQTRLESLNFGRGVADHQSTLPGGDSTDFTITRRDGVVLNIDLAGAETIQDVLDAINGHSDNTPNDPGGPPALLARPAAYGNGVELVDGSIGPGELRVARATFGTAAIDLGLVPQGSETNAAVTGTIGSTQPIALSPGGTMTVETRYVGAYGNGVQVVFQNAGGAAESLAYDPDPADPTLTFFINPGTTTADTVRDLLENDPVAGQRYTVQFEGSDGTGTVDAVGSFQLSGGTDDTLTGSDVNPLESEGILNALYRLKRSLETNNTLEATRAVELLDQSVLQLNFARAELGARQQGLDLLKDRLDLEELDLKEVLSLNLDVDMVEVISNLTARQASYEASLRATGEIFRMTLLNYL